MRGKIKKDVGKRLWINLSLHFNEINNFDKLRNDRLKSQEATSFKARRQPSRRYRHL